VNTYRLQWMIKCQKLACRDTATTLGLSWTVLKADDCHVLANKMVFSMRFRHSVSSCGICDLRPRFLMPNTCPAGGKLGLPFRPETASEAVTASQTRQQRPSDSVLAIHSGACKRSARETRRPLTAAMCKGALASANYFPLGAKVPKHVLASSMLAGESSNRIHGLC
jgi:hypothetical protein